MTAVVIGAWPIAKFFETRHWRQAVRLHSYAGMPKRFVYILKSESVPHRYYTGVTSNVSQRLILHNAGLSAHTASGRPWKVIVSIEFETEARAVQFERYLKSGSGGAFARRHFR